jgi:hypothetical protein
MPEILRALDRISGELKSPQSKQLLIVFSIECAHITNGFSKKLDNHVAAVALYVAHYNLCRVHEALRTTPAKALVE